MKHENPFAKLGALDQQLYQDTAPKPRLPATEGVREKAPPAKSQNAGMPANQYSRLPANPKASKLASQTSGNPASQQTGKPNVPDLVTATEKVTYRFHSEGKYAVEDMKTVLARKHGIKASLEEIAEESILLAYEDLLENQHASKLANRLARTPDNKHSS
jgi:hypothetical protein